MIILTIKPFTKKAHILLQKILKLVQNKVQIHFFPMVLYFRNPC